MSDIETTTVSEAGYQSTSEFGDVELDEFTPVELSRWFAVGFAILTTIAIEALVSRSSPSSSRIDGSGPTF